MLHHPFFTYEAAKQTQMPTFSCSTKSLVSFLSIHQFTFLVISFSTNGLVLFTTSFRPNSAITRLFSISRFSHGRICSCVSTSPLVFIHMLSFLSSFRRAALGTFQSTPGSVPSSQLCRHIIYYTRPISLRHKPSKEFALVCHAPPIRLTSLPPFSVLQYFVGPGASWPLVWNSCPTPCTYGL
jgi:hypothetical protein